MSAAKWALGALALLGLGFLMTEKKPTAPATLGPVAASVRRAFDDANRQWPTRSKRSDGTLPSAAHLASNPTSDHNTGEAFDLTHDPASGCTGELIAELATYDGRTKYVIWNRRIWNVTRRAEGWRPYTGPNPHTTHCHVSILASARNDVSPWPWAPEKFGAEDETV